MRLILVLLVLLYVSLLNVEKCSSKTLNDYYLKSTECNSSSCSGIQYFISSNNFEVGSTITICNIKNEELAKEKPIGKKHSSIGSDVLQAVANSVQSAMNGAVSSIGSLSGGGDDGDDDDDDDSGSGLYKSLRELYKGGHGKVVSEKPIRSFDKKHTSIGSDVLQAVANSVQSAMNGAVSTIASLSGGGTSDDGDFVKGGDAASYKGGHGKSISDILDLIRPPRNHYGKCIKVLAVDLDNEKSVDGSIISGSKKICIDLFGLEECKLEEQRIISAVQSTKNDGFPNEGQFYVSQEEYNTIIKHGQILKNQCQLKGKSIICGLLNIQIEGRFEAVIINININIKSISISISISISKLISKSISNHISNSNINSNSNKKGNR
ncbi:hypothetical protein ACTFIV_011264 [Dictyostelium citrinum]